MTSIFFADHDHGRSLTGWVRPMIGESGRHSPRIQDSPHKPYLKQLTYSSYPVLAP